MATEVYNRGNIYLIDGTELEILPLKIKYLREFMFEFEGVKNASDDDSAIEVLVKCVGVCMKQYYPRSCKIRSRGIYSGYLERLSRTRRVIIYARTNGYSSQ
jgi:hypothetical protein